MSVTIYGSGQIVKQVIQGSVAASVSTGSTSFVTTGLSASITPTSSSNKVLVTVTLVGCYIGASNTNVYYTIYRNGSNIAPTGSGIAQSFAKLYGNTSANQSTQSFSFLDSPSTTSATTYTIYFAVGGNTGYINVNGETSYILLSEISGT